MSLPSLNQRYKPEKPVLHYQSSVSKCPLCDSDSQTYLFIRNGTPVYRCNNCGLTGLHPQPSNIDILAYYANTTGYNPFADVEHLTNSLTESAVCKDYLHILEKQKVAKKGMLVVMPKGHPFAELAKAAGFEVETVLDIHELEQTDLPENHYESVVLLFQVERAKQPVQLLRHIHQALKPNSLIFLVTPSLDSWSARFFRSQWTEWRPESFYYFDSQTIQDALLRSGFIDVTIRRDHRSYSLKHLYNRACAYPRTSLTRMVRAFYHFIPPVMGNNLRLNLPASGIVVTARSVQQRKRPVLSIVMPVYNEKATFAATMDTILAKEVPGFDKEIIVVESNSKDGTRDIVLRYQTTPGVKIILEDQPKGKGRAVRTGFEHATGDIILIQDADQEYDVNDYDALIAPLQLHQRAFVLGSRHTASWKMREFNDQPGMAAFFNLGHLIFTGLVNLLYGQRLKDPFTMYKVFRRDCLHGLKFECDGFDFDFELVIKLLRKGYVPLEVPVNYKARSFKEGKKVSAVRDPITWVRALLKYRFVSIYEDGR